ncbi:MAG TPA: DNA polymerase III subunit gamma/tau [Chitinophagaceae bacterium]|nr:DNA polymerase III subunit gamma/tau [Chitinophagaceae bacterium]
MEKFIVSARKYRPQTFDTVVGQAHITTTLKNAIKTQQLAHAFLFCGPRGVGKTTCARILAKTINCERINTDGEACNECHSCLSFNEGTSLNVHELDAASNNSVDDIRSLVEQVRFTPQAGKYKVYIIDEVHMLSSAAFNAFLKTLEEPPPYAKFILATTEKHKILPTILSRCQIFDFKRITLHDTVDHLKAITAKEQVTAEEAGLQLIAQKSEGCMRDALSIMDKIISFTGGQLTYPNTLEHLNILDEEFYFRFIDCMLTQDLASAMLLYDDIDKKGFEGDMVLNGFASFIRNLLVCKDPRVAGLLEVVDSFKTRYTATAQKTETGLLVSALNILNDAEINYRSARSKRLHVELCLIKLCYLQQALQLAGNGTEIERKKTVEDAKPLSFKSLTPIALKESKATAPITTSPAPVPKQPAKLMIETAMEGPVESRVEEPKQKQLQQTEEKSKTGAAPKARLGALDAIRKKVQQENGTLLPEQDQPITHEKLTAAWQVLIKKLKEDRNPAWQSFDLAGLSIKDQNSFVATAANNLQQRFLELERNKACLFLQKELNNRLLKFSIVLTEGEHAPIAGDLPLSAKEQYNKIVEQFPLVKELKERLKLDLDF